MARCWLRILGPLVAALLVAACGGAVDAPTADEATSTMGPSTTTGAAETATSIDEPDGSLVATAAPEHVEVVGNDVGLPGPVSPDGRVVESDEPAQCSLANIGADRVVRAEVTGGRRRLVRRPVSGGEFLVDVWPVSSSDVFVGELPADLPIDEVSTSAGTALNGLWRGTDARVGEFLVFGAPLRRQPSQLVTVAVGHDDGGEFVFDWPCPDQLNADLATVAEFSERRVDEALAVAVMTDRETPGSPGKLLADATS